jgi:hypothetical protein
MELSVKKQRNPESLVLDRQILERGTRLETHFKNLHAFLYGLILSFAVNRDSST